ncbi:hypothetical protein B0T44_24295 [Nocardia donostiensis]|nr:hypothetical protein B0T44_24295 [Nocardia donostiensis]
MECAALPDNTRSYAPLDPESRQWQQRPWTDVRDLGLRIATRVLDAGSGPRQPVGLVGETTAEVVAAVFGCWAAGRPISIMPMPVRGSDQRLWSESTMRRLRALGCGMVLAHGPVLELLRGTAGHLPVHDLAQVAGWRWDSAASLVRVPPDSPAVLQGTAGSTGTPRTAVLSHNAVLNHFWGLYDRTRAGSDDVLCSWLPMYHDMGLMLTVSGMAAGLATWLAPTKRVRQDAPRVVELAQCEFGDCDRCPGFRIQPDRTIRPANGECRTRSAALHDQRRRAGRLRRHDALRRPAAAIRSGTGCTRTRLRAGRSNVRGDRTGPRAGRPHR